ncbi:MULTISPECIES: hypothetical protein [Legionella]|uniref:hypothetical protein n=1 Tax=Legionella TaxID=445 RepID=UPI00072FFAFF|nr:MULTISPECIES: hypothetical protein [Legionella]MCE3045439.1 hypothetical protein [Legionella sp. 16cNR16C]
MKTKTILPFIVLLTLSQVCDATPPANFAQAKKIAAVVFKPHPITLYCQCHYQNKQIDLASCQMDAAADKKTSVAPGMGAYDACDTRSHNKLLS